MGHDIVLEMDSVSKLFRRGENHDTLRDLLPALAKRLLGRREPSKRQSREFWALKDVSFSLGRGQVLGIIGHNGAGKSTLLKLLVGLMKPTSGSIRAHGTMSALIEISAGFHPDLTGRENVYLKGAILGLSRAEVARKFDEIVAFSGIEEFLDTPVKRYSTGMHARLGFSVAAHVDPEILIVDEVLSVGDFVFQKKCMQRMQEIVRSGTSIVFVSHNLSAMSQFCDSLILLDHGRITLHGTPDEVISTYFSKSVESSEDSSGKDAYVSRLVIRNAHGPALSFEAGEPAWVDVEVTANQPCKCLSLTVYFRDNQQNEAYGTSSMRLGDPPMMLQPGQRRSFTFRFSLHLVQGMYTVGAAVYRFDVGQVVDERWPLGTVLVRSPIDAKGVANLYPELLRSEDSLTALPAPTDSGEEAPSSPEACKAIPGKRHHKATVPCAE